MRLEELKLLIRNGVKKNETFPLFQLMKLQSVAKVDLEMDRDSDEYYYKVDLQSLVNKQFDREIITDNGWTLSEDEKYMILKI